MGLTELSRISIVGEKLRYIRVISDNTSGGMRAVREEIHTGSESYIGQWIELEELVRQIVAGVGLTGDGVSVFEQSDEPPTANPGDIWIGG